ncbi:MAG: SIS domain-containing protein, partial [Erysipelotrichaceae bacterium]|nr:SIS domain-containing protein [Erysipelotrichaceae bacterium]
MLFEYGDRILEVIQKAEETNKDTIRLLAEKFAENIENDKIIHTFGTGHSHMLGIELFARAGGLGNVDAMLDPDTLTSFGAQR